MSVPIVHNEKGYGELLSWQVLAFAVVISAALRSMRTPYQHNIMNPVNDVPLPSPQFVEKKNILSIIFTMTLTDPLFFFLVI